MELNSDFTRELKALNGSKKEDRFPVVKKGEKAAAFIAEDWRLSNPKTMDDVIDAIAASIETACHKFGRAIVGICLAATILIAEPGRLSRRSTDWARTVMSVWTNHSDGHVSRIAIRATSTNWE